jgi:drug/metabolite transporter (DMT)-like permease
VNDRLRMAMVYLLLCIFWPTTWLVIKVTLRGAPPLLGCSLRFLVAGLCLAGFRLASGYSLRLRRDQWRPVIVVALGYFAITYAVLYVGETHITAGLAALLSSTTPLFIIILANFLLPDEALNWQKLAGVLIGLAGLALVFHGGLSIGSSGAAVVAMVAIGVSAIGYAYAQIVVRRDARDVPGVLLNAWAMTIGGLIVLALSLVSEPHHIDLNAATLGSIVYLALPGTVLPYAGMVWLLKRSSAGTVGLLGLVLPVIALFEGWLFLSEPLDWALVVGAAIVVGGLLMATLKPKSATVSSQAGAR